jgi:hypothetical protein
MTTRTISTQPPDGDRNDDWTVRSVLALVKIAAA